MKKIYSFLFVLLAILVCCPWTINAETLKIGSNDSYTTNSPVWGNKANNYVLSQIIYSASELTKLEGQKITALTFYTRSSYASNIVFNNMEVRITERATSTFSAASDWEDVSGVTPQFSGQLDATGSAMVITLTTAYEYQGGNLVVDIRNSAKGTATQSGKPRFQATSASNTVVYDYNSSSSTPTSYAERVSVRPDVLFTYEEAEETGGCANPKNLALSASTPDAATFTWEQGAEETTYQWACVEKGVEVTSWNDLAADVRTKQVTGLTAGTSYDFWVRSYCGDGEGEQSTGVKKNFTLTCPAPTFGATPVSDKTHNAATVTWNAAEGITKYQFVNVAQNATPDWDGVEAKEVTSVELSGLSELTNYDFYVRSWYSATAQSAAVKTSFQTGADCSAKTVDAEHPWTENFTNHATNAMPTCWTAAGNTSAVYVASSSSYLTFSYGNALYFTGGSGTQAIAVLPDFETDVNTLQIAFSHIEEHASNSGKIQFGYYKDETFTSLKGDGYDISTSWKDESAIAITGVPEGAKLAFAYKPNKSAYTAAVDNITISVYEAPACAQPENLKVDQIGTDSAVVTWTSAAANFALQYKKAGDAEWTDAIGEITSPFVLKNLLPSKTAYTVRVKADCGGSQSDWVVSSEFETQCETVTFGWSESFDAETLSECWPVTVGDASNSAWELYKFADEGTYSGYSVRFKGKSGYAASTLQTPAIVLTDKAALNFYWTNMNGLAVDVKVSTDGGTTKTSIEHSLSTATTTKKTAKSIDLSDYEGDTVILYFSAQGNSSSLKYLYIDEVSIDYAPVATPTDLTAEAGNANATIIWATAEGVTWNLHYRAQGAEAWIDSTGLTANTKVLNGLTNGTTYEVQVQAYVNEHRSSAWTASVEFTPAACPSVTAVTFGAATYNSVVVNWTASAAGTWDLHYKAGEGEWTLIKNINALTTTLNNLTTNAVYTVEVKPSCSDAWVAAANTFTPVYSTPANAAVASITDAAATASWDAVADAAGYKVAIALRGETPEYSDAITKTDSTFTNLSAATEYDFYVAAVYGEHLEAAEKVEFATVTIAPKNLEQVGESTTDGASFQWEANGAATQYQWSTDNTNWSEAIDSTHVTLKGLNSGSSYTFYVRSYYSVTVQSAAINLPFKTECGTIATSKTTAWVEDFENGVDCWQMIRKNTNFNLPAVSTTDKKEGEKSLRFYGSGSTSNAIAVLPQTSKDIKKLQISFFYKNGSTDTSRPQFGVGYITNPENVATYVQLKALNRNTAWTNTGDIDLSDATTGAYIAICYYGGSNDVAGFVDSVVVSELPTCLKPKNLEASTLYNSATLTWAAGNEETAWVVEYATTNDFAEPIVKAAETTPSLPLTGLTTGTKYYARVKASCGGEDYSEYSDVVEFTPNYLAPTNVAVSEITTTGAKVTWTANSGEAAWTLQYRLYGATEWNSEDVATTPVFVLTELVSGTNYEVRVLAGTIASDTEMFNTECAVIATLPWSENFAGTELGKMPYCWQLLNASLSDIPYINVTNTDPKTLCFRSDDHTAYAILPEFNIDFSKAQASFTYEVENKDNCTLVFGYLTDAADAATFQPLRECQPTASWNWKEEQAIKLTTVPANARLAFKYTGALPYYFDAYVGNVRVEEIPACEVPTDLEVVEFGADSAKFNWTSGASTWKLQYSTDGTVWSDVIPVEAKPYVLKGLAENTKYYVHVAAICGESNESEYSTAIDFTTDCAVRTMDYKPSWATELPECWTFTGKSGGWKIADNLLRYEKNTGFAGAATLPTIHVNEANYPIIRIEYSNKSGQNKVDASISVVADDVDSTYTLAEHSTIALMELDLAKFKGKDVTITINVASGACVFDIETFQVINKPLYTPQNVAAQAGDGQATITWEAGGNEIKWQLYYNVKEDAEATWSDELTEKTYTITGLTNGVTYCVHVKGFYEIGGWTVGSDVVEFTPSKPTAIDNTEAADKAYKVVEDGQVVIIRNGEKRNILGTKIQ